MTSERASSLIDEKHNFDSRAFRKCLSQYITGVTVITADNGQTRFGVTANSFSSLSLDPPLILWSIGRTSRSFELFEKTHHFAVNILAAEQIEISQVFSSTAVDKFANVSWSRGRNGAPILGGILAAIECRQEAVYDGGDHIIIVGRVENFSIFEGDGLLFAQGRYRITADHPQMTTTDQIASRGQVGSEAAPAMSFFMQLFWAFHCMSENFEDYRRGANITLPQGRILSRLYDCGQLSIQEIVSRTYLTLRVCEDAASDLVEQQCIIRDPFGNFSLTDIGRSRREALGVGEIQFETQQTADISPQDIATTRRVLAKIIEKNRDKIAPGHIKVS